VLNPPRDLAEEDVVAALAEHWRLDVATVAYRPVGFGSHHWLVTDVDGVRRFASVDELDARRKTTDEGLSGVLGRLNAAFLTASELAQCGLDFVTAPMLVPQRVAAVGLGERFAIRVEPFIEGRSFKWGDYEDVDHRSAVFRMVVDVHTSPRAAWRRALVEDFALPFRTELESALAGEVVEDCGPFTARAARLLAENTSSIRALLARYECLAAAADPRRMVLTHGEPHAGNTMHTPEGWKLIDWDTALIAPPERDLWTVDPGDGSTFAAYRAAAGVEPLPSMIELYRLQWDLTETALYSHQFRTPHHGDANDDTAWQGFVETVGKISGSGPQSSV
jgi:hypothetical protein